MRELQKEGKIGRIEDVRGSKRDFILERAKKLLENLDDGHELGEMSRTLKEESRTSKIQEYGDEKLPAGDISGNEIIVVIDGDRGGKLIARNVIENARVTYVAVAPDGKEVEELQGKEILMSLRKRIPTDEFLR